VPGSCVEDESARPEASDQHAYAFSAPYSIEEAFAVVKRLLGLAYFWTGGENGIAVQVWATWILYVVLVDLRDAVAEELGRPADALSLEMVYRALYHFTQAYHRGETTDPVGYLAAEAKGLGLLKQKRPRALARLLDLTPAADSLTCSYGKENK
jgi:hypothetical protein